MNQVAIDLSNRGVAELQRGDPVAAFQSLSKAANIVMVGIHNHHHVSTGAEVFNFHWEDCSSAIAPRRPTESSPAWEGSTPFLFLRALRISTSTFATSVDEIEHLCPCGYAWVIWFNLALCCSVLGTRLGEKGKLFLEMAYDLYQKVQRRVDSEPSNKHWKMLAMAVSNNQACIFHDFAMHGDAVICLQRLASTLSLCQDLEVADRGDFCLNLQILSSSHTLAAAA
mmetsp:Transcript_135686/g.201800  ORF Transcript_135686/g.201800 Transcript_135686/m.201800 type:complete len:226 (+) Transcript_135686:137-814(+)|eukprot:CAMPEP_0117041980 /NCGR_PEP_ID=MMETSP0472-20121206/29268_1 /TAXON_ID=693140 ORGANISM="Tiarina fusus, Strain LIS" /NCGR_SAMPLE_ID=MMETSP0472 /ASSEMBLY_ACC=CAM_ASM_000603 /LENGTH=225 /DNA_ID=CAMNT_0004753107 /DNA_START=134 /DNA_END=811 /DNA_ORIENTATION=-